MDHHGRTARLELEDANIRRFTAQVLDVSSEGIVLDRSAFYPGGGGQPPDFGALTFDGNYCRIYLTVHCNQETAIVWLILSDSLQSDKVDF